jgi:hypothetical protein
MRRTFLRSTLLLLVPATCLHLAQAQYAERPDLFGSGSPAVDVSGRSVKNPRVRAVHTDDPSLVGGTAWLLRYDPFLAYQLGRNLNYREFRERDGVLDAHVSSLTGPMPDGTTAKITANNQVSCLGCHNTPNGNPGGGTNFSKDSGRGRAAPHYFGAGLVEMLGIQVRQWILLQCDSNRDGWISASEARAAPQGLSVSTGADGGTIDVGNPRLDGGMTGSPQLNNVFRIWYVDARGRYVPGASAVDGVTTHGYDLEMVIWGAGQGPGRGALNPTNRAFLWDPWKVHGGLEACDPCTLDDPEGDGVSRPTLCGALQFPATHRPPDHGDRLDPRGFSRDDPDGDGCLNEISEGDLDLGEWFLLNTPRPAFAGTSEQYRHGVRAMRALGCLECHVADWRIEPSGRDFAGDRRLFDLETRWNEGLGRLEGRLVPLYELRGGEYRRGLGPFAVHGLFSDLLHHDMGAGFREVDFGGTVNTLWRTAPLWGVGSSFPWGHDGASLTLEDAILRHDGEGAAAKAAWQAAPAAVKQVVLAFLRRLVLYDIESLPTDVDGDGVISERFVVAGVDTGYERFNAEWLFRVPVRIQGEVTNADGEVIRSFAALNLADAYGLQLPLRRDSDLDGWPDVWDNAPRTPGYHDGVR